MHKNPGYSVTKSLGLLGMPTVMMQQSVYYDKKPFPRKLDANPMDARGKAFL